MGYYTRVSGEISIEPPLTWSEFKNSQFADDTSDSIDVRLNVTEETVDADEGQLIRKTAAGLIPSWDDSFKAYHLLEHVQRAIDEFPGHTFSGRLDCEGEESGDLWRVVVRGRQATKVEPQLIWPDET